MKPLYPICSPPQKTSNRASGNAGKCIAVAGGYFQSQGAPEAIAAVERVALGPTVDGWSPRERALLHAVDALLTNRDIDDDSWQAVSTHLREPQLVELCLLVGHYDMLAMTVAALRIAPDFGTSARAAKLARIPA